ncbi:MAG: RtcB family protein, partial [Acidobacteriaceae bacterium]|nr:RtcB family protein [Acidobacteriaceae bacterium]
MTSEIVLEPVDEYRYRISRNEAAGMRTDVLVYSSRKLIAHIQKDQSLVQAMNVATLPGIVGPSLAMPDIHQGYGFPIGGVAATDIEEGVVSPGGVGFDINCGVRLVRSTLTRADVQSRMKQLIDQVFRDVPCGTGTEGRVRLKRGEIDHVLRSGARWMAENGYGEAADSERAEAMGAIEGALPSKVSDRAKERGTPQLGTLGSGNHFLEVQYVDRIHDHPAA